MRVKYLSAISKIIVQYEARIRELEDYVNNNLPMNEVQLKDTAHRLIKRFMNVSITNEFTKSHIRYVILPMLYEEKEAFEYLHGLKRDKVFTADRPTIQRPQTNIVIRATFRIENFVKQLMKEYNDDTKAEKVLRQQFEICQEYRSHFIKEDEWFKSAPCVIGIAE